MLLSVHRDSYSQSSFCNEAGPIWLTPWSGQGLVLQTRRFASVRLVHPGITTAEDPVHSFWEPGAQNIAKLDLQGRAPCDEFS